jgi:membrane protein DedA with SNARE-associated domain
LAAVDPLLSASVTDHLVTIATNLIGDLGLPAVALLVFTSATIGMPGTEPTMLFAGFDVYEHQLNLPGVIIAGLLGDVAGACVAYAIGYYGSRELLERQGSKLHVSPAALARAHRWFERFGSPALLVSRCLPLIRAVFPYVAGVGRMAFARFLALATLGSLVWMSFLALLGRGVGSQWQAWRRHLEIIDYIGAVLIVGAIAYLVIRRLRGRRRGAPEPTADVVPD